MSLSNQTAAFAWQIPRGLIPDDDFQADPDEDQADRLEFAQTLFTDRKISLTARSFREEIRAGDFSKAQSELSRLQLADPKLLVPMANGTWGPLFLNVLQDFELLPAAMQDKLLRESSAAANRRLIEILDQQDIQALPQFWLRYAGTEQAMQALILMSRLQLDRGQNRSAAIWLRVVAESGRPKYAAIAKQQLQRIRANDDVDSDAAVTDVVEKAESESVDESSHEFPKFASWAYQPSISPTLDAQVAAFLSMAKDNFVSPSSSWEPALDYTRAFQRTMRGIAAVDLESGEELWHYPISPALDQKLLKDRNHSNVFAQVMENPKSVTSFYSLDQSLFANLFCRDEVQTRPIVSNGRVFLVTTDDSVKAPAPNAGRLFGGPPSATAPFQLGQLIALDAKSGQRIWTVGRATLQQHLGAGDFGVWFYGPPCVTDQSVLAVFEWKGEIRLGRFAVETGQYISSSPISLPEQTIDKDVIRTLWACTPVRDSGLLWTTTSTGWLLCLDETTLSVVWASRLADAASLRSTSSVRRGRVAALTAQESLSQRWNRSMLKLVGDRMLVLSQDAYEAVLLDSRTGQRIQTIAVSKDQLIYADDIVFVLSDGDFIRCFEIADGSQICKQRIHDYQRPDSVELGVKPTGRGALRGDDVLVPLSNGYLAKLDLKTGHLSQGGSRLLPLNGWGHLVSAPGNRLLYVSAQQVLHLSNTRPQKPAGEHLQRGRELLAKNNPKAALQEAKQVTEADRDFRSAQKLAFECLLQLAESEPQTYLDQLKAASNTEMQQAKQHVLEIELLMAGDKPVRAISVICDVLKMSNRVIHSPSRSVNLNGSQSELELASDGKRQSEQIDLTIRTWALSALSELLSEVQPNDWPADALDSIPESLFPSIRSSAAVSFLRDRVSQSESQQVAFELLQRVVQLRSEQQDLGGSLDYADEIQIFDEFLGRVLSDENSEVGVPQSVLRRLISVAVAEMPASFVEAVQAAGTFEKWSLVWPDQLREQQFQVQQDWYAEWDSGDWTAFPIRTRYSYSEVRGVSDRLSIADQKDAFLNQYLWTVGSSSPGRLFSSSFIGDVQSDWSIPLGDVTRAGSQRLKWISRSGSILLLRSDLFFTAVSLLDREVLWSIPVPAPSALSANAPFRKFVALGRDRPGSDSAPLWRVLSSGDGCISIAEDNRCRSLDLLTGELLWEATLSAVSFPVVPGPGNTLLLTDSDRVPYKVDAALGDFRAVESLAEKQLRVIHHNDSQVVIWDQEDTDMPMLSWVNLDNSKANEQANEQGDKKFAVEKTVALRQFEYFQFLDASTLAAINASGNLRVIDLDDGEYQDYQVPFSKPEFPTSIRHTFLAASNHFLYVGFPSASNNVARFSSTDRRVSFSEELFVLDRKTGTVTATVESEEGAALSFQDPRFPMMLVSTQPNRDSRRGPLSLRCFGVNGKEVRFEGRFPFDSSVRSLGYRVNRMRSFDFIVNGASFRIETPDDSVKPDADKD